VRNGAAFAVVSDDGGLQEVSSIKGTPTGLPGRDNFMKQEKHWPMPQFRILSRAAGYCRKMTFWGGSRHREGRRKPDFFADMDRRVDRARGFTLFELLIAVVLLGVISVMIYSVLNVSIKFSDKGERALEQSVRQHGLLNLLYRQIATAYYDNIQKTVLVSGSDEVLRVVTWSPLHYRSSGVALALYRYDPGSRVLYYTERQDYYNTDYDEEYLPDFNDMLVLASDVAPLSFEVDEETRMVTVSYGDNIFEMQPRCAPESGTLGEANPK